MVSDLVVCGALGVSGIRHAKHSNPADFCTSPRTYWLLPRSRAGYQYQGSGPAARTRALGQVPVPGLRARGGRCQNAEAGSRGTAWTARSNFQKTLVKLKNAYQYQGSGLFDLPCTSAPRASTREPWYGHLARSPGTGTWPGALVLVPGPAAR